ncbi:hypothetical protein [Sphingomonas mesophila]|uniref:hypothetical protein n=1 Tax=Sphingomonas mesophila TaxID=2303576 RepID=UPI000E5945FF|nr:hypothetical protein [Sphingomonas mesophila]
MLDRLEALYLNLLRGFILLLATCALVAALFLGMSAIPSLIERLGTPKADTSGLTLAKFVSEQKMVSADLGGEKVDIADVLIAPEVADAAAAIHEYLGKRATVSRKELATILQKSGEQIPLSNRNEYYASTANLATELKASKGKPLSETRVFDMLAWHEQRFTSDWQAKVLEKADADAAFRYRTWAALVAFMTFILVAFVFLFVRMERNTRLVHVKRAVEDA